MLVGYSWFEGQTDLQGLFDAKLVGDGSVALPHCSLLKGALLTQLVLQQLQLRVEPIEKENINKLRERETKKQQLYKRDVLPLFLLEDGVAVGLVFAEEMVSRSHF